MNSGRYIPPTFIKLTLSLITGIIHISLIVKEVGMIQRDDAELIQ